MGDRILICTHLTQPTPIDTRFFPLHRRCCGQRSGPSWRCWPRGRSPSSPTPPSRKSGPSRTGPAASCRYPSRRSAPTDQRSSSSMDTTTSTPGTSPSSATLSTTGSTRETCAASTAWTCPRSRPRRRTISSSG
ncbi:hypothetical protein FOCC_FOCC017108 [Frankliniella occidentalis]|nr:hypothetical protein FOCC_FOCC017108 [Frankliniella occidentalis]